MIGEPGENISDLLALRASEPEPQEKSEQEQQESSVKSKKFRSLPTVEYLPLPVRECGRKKKELRLLLFPVQDRKAW